ECFRDLPGFNFTFAGSANETYVLWSPRRIFAMAHSSFNGPVTDTSTGAGDHRVWLRFPSRMSTVCHSAGSDNESDWLVQVHDVSRRGLKLLSPHKFEQGTTINIGDADDDAGKAPAIVARVVNISAAPN